MVTDVFFFFFSFSFLNLYYSPSVPIIPHLIFHRLTVVSVSFCSLKICILCYAIEQRSFEFLCVCYDPMFKVVIDFESHLANTINYRELLFVSM